MSVERWSADPACFNVGAQLPFELRIEDFRMAMQDVHDFFHDVNTGLIAMRASWMYRDQLPSQRSAAKRAKASQAKSK